MAVRVSADKRFRRARVSPGRRRSWRAAWVRNAVAIAAALAAVAFTGYHLRAMALSSDAFRITTIAVSGHERLSTDEVAALLEPATGLNMFAADIDVWRRKLLASPWVADASVRRVLPGTLSVSLLERRAVGIGRIDGTLYLIDRAGTIIDGLAPAHADLDLPIIDGLAEGRSGALRVDERRAALAGRLLTALQTRPDLAARVSQIDVTDVHDAVVVLRDDTTLLRLGRERFVERLQSYLEFAPALRERVRDIDYVDLRYLESGADGPERVIVRPGPGRAPAADRPGRRRTSE